MNEETKKRIVEFNKQFGLNTEFITDENVLGYALNNTIYINSNLEHDYERTNKHELLHFFEETEEFKKVKEEILDANKENIDAIRSEYELRYFGLYSEDEIKAGVLDTEIAIDLLIDNSLLEYEEGLKIGDNFLGEVKTELENKRYLNLTYSKNIENLNLSKIEKLFVANYYDGKKHQLPQKDKANAIRADIENYLQELYELGENEFTIDANSPEIIREYESEIKALKQRGENTELLEANKEKALNELAEKFSKQSYEEYKHIVDFIKGEEYEPAFKCLMLRETLTKTYKIDKDEENNKTIIKNRDLHKSIAGHMVLNKTTLDFICKHIEEYDKFANLYFASLEIFNKTIAQESTITLENVDTYGKGKWLKFEGKGSNEEEYLKNAEKLSALVKDTPWCTKTLAATQLAEGDFFVFVDNNEKPHIAVKTNGNEIDEVRGIKNGNAQELEEDYRDVAISFLEGNKDIQNGKEWLEKEEWNKRLIEYGRKIDVGELTKEDVPQMLDDLFSVKDYRSHGGRNSNKTELINKVEKNKNTKKIIIEYCNLNCTEEELYCGDIAFRDTDFEVNPYKIILGDASFNGSKVKDLGNLEIIWGSAFFNGSKVTNLGSLTFIGEDAFFEHSKVTNLGSLTSIGGNAYFENSKLTNLGNLTSIGGIADFTYSKVTNLGNLTIIVGDARFFKSKVTDIGKIQYIGGEICDGNKNTNLKEQYELRRKKIEADRKNKLTGANKEDLMEIAKKQRKGEILETLDEIKDINSERENKENKNTEESRR